MDSTTIFILGIGTLVIAATAYSVYVSFGAPSVELDDPFEDHED